MFIKKLLRLETVKSAFIIIVILNYMFIYLPLPIRLENNNSDCALVQDLEIKKYIQIISSLKSELFQCEEKLVSPAKCNNSVNNGKQEEHSSYVISKEDDTLQEYLHKNIFNKLTSIKSDVIDLWYFIRSQLKITKTMLKQKNDNSHVIKVLEHTDSEITERKAVLVSQIENITMGYQSKLWRKKLFIQLSSQVQNKIKQVQNPTNCMNANKIVCEIKNCGFGCQLHSLMSCLITAYSTNRTLIIDSSQWSYSNKGWEHFFQPISDTCTSKHGKSYGFWGQNNDHIQIIELRDITAMGQPRNFLPPAVPKEIGDKLALLLYKDPSKWWIGQFAKYLIRYNSATVSNILQANNQLRFHGPIVGVHIRRTDKLLSEAKKHEVAEYMKHVKDFFLQLKFLNKSPVLQIYLATDDPAVVTETKEKYPEFSLITVSNNTLQKRYTEESFEILLQDLYFLSHADHLVCTFSSSMCRLAYEIKQSVNSDAESMYNSLDDIPYFIEGNPVFYTALYNHTAQNNEEISFKAGDTLSVVGNHWDGYSVGAVKGTQTTGKFPFYKVEQNQLFIDL